MFWRVACQFWFMLVQDVACIESILDVIVFSHRAGGLLSVLIDEGQNRVAVIEAVLTRNRGNPNFSPPDNICLMSSHL